MRLTQVRIAGFGGQGVILAATVIGRAATLHANLYATMTQSFGPESRGGASSAQVILSSEPVLYPYVISPDVLMVLSQEACTRFVPGLAPGATLIVEEDLVRLSSMPPGVRLYGVPATRLAEELGKKMVLNMVSVGFFGSATGLLSREALRAAVAEAVPPHFRDVNLRAFDRGFDYGMYHNTPQPTEVVAPARRELEG
jgi:2-oxoglutarate ferredoxin oxidoreductase subunit gamma